MTSLLRAEQAVKKSILRRFVSGHDVSRALIESRPESGFSAACEANSFPEAVAFPQR